MTVLVTSSTPAASAPQQNDWQHRAARLAARRIVPPRVKGVRLTFDTLNDVYSISDAQGWVLGETIERDYYGPEAGTRKAMMACR